jgi:hypothetical protein
MTVSIRVALSVLVMVEVPLVDLPHRKRVLRLRWWNPIPTHCLEVRADRGHVELSLTARQAARVRPGCRLGALN